KTLNLSMVKYFFDCCPTETPGGTEQNHKELFTPFQICRAGGEYLRGQGKHPVIFISFRNIKELDWDSCWSKIKQLVQGEYLKHDYLLDSAKLKPTEKEYFKKIIDLTGGKGDYENSLEKLLFYLTRFYDRKAVILVDEYDAPIHAGFSHDYYEEIVNFMRNFLGGGLKDTDRYLEKGIISGIMRVAKESIFSGLNNLGVYTLTSVEFENHFGFTEKEVAALLNDFVLLDRYAEVQQWYNGYLFGGKVIYNPWSIINFLGNKGKELKPYWINTSDNRIVETLLSKGGKELKEELEQLIRGEHIEKAVEENIVLKDIFSNEDSLWSFLLMGGYMRQSFSRQDDVSGKIYYALSIPNKEVRTAYAKVVDRYFSAKIENKKLETMLSALIAGDVKLFEKMLKKIVAAVCSYFDFGVEPEKVYHALTAGLLVWISNTHEIKSNRESGYGRYDIMVIPRDISGTGYVIEFKTAAGDDNETVESAAKAALSQIEEKQYETELVERGIKNIKKLAIVFRGKDVYVKESD
ncbi:MAG: AAA family ATPase, partial [Candidatus Aminicenantes bacterium]|nr:AAA family ATPase [Candidatus Aminicenantes bacterium]